MLIFLFVLAIGFLLLATYMWIQAQKNTIVEETLAFSDFPKSFGELKIFFISDIHRRHVSEKIINKVKKAGIDLVIIGGDLAEKGVPFSRIETNLKRLRSLGPTYFVWGNNDYEVDYHELDAMFVTNDIKTLDNTAVQFESLDGDILRLLGVDDIARKRENLALALMDADGPGFKILVSHNPLIINKIQKSHQISFVLSGHTHGGQIRFFNFGLYEKGKIKKLEYTTLLVSNGYGTTGIPLRLGAPAQTHLITIKNSFV